MIRPTYIVTLLLLAVSLCFTACEKDPTIKEVHEDLVVNNNQIPPYFGVTAIEIQNYVNKLYIELYGREPSSQEMDDGVNYLVAGQLDSTARSNFINQLANSQEYYNRLDDILSNNLLEGFDSLEIQRQVNQFKAIAYQDSVNGGVQYIFIKVEITKLEDLLVAKNDYRTGTITMNELYGRFVYNYFYDEINMGSENFVKACFENLLKRLPTAVELDYGVKMVDGESKELFLMEGDDKLDFVEIVTNADEFYQGVVIDFFATALVREPTSYEMTQYATAMKTSGDLLAFQREILITEEYAGF